MLREHESRPDPFCSNDAIKRIGEVGRRQWRKESGTHRQARAENGMYRYKRIIGDRLRAQHRESQKRETLDPGRIQAAEAADDDDMVA